MDRKVTWVRIVKILSPPSPADGATVVPGVVAFKAAADDPEDGNLDGEIDWSVVLVGTGEVASDIDTATFSPTLAVGTYEITATVEDSESQVSTDTHTLIVSTAPVEPEGFELSKDDFATVESEPFEFLTSDTVFMKVFTDKEFATIKKTEYKIKMQDKTEVKGVLINQGGGIFTASTDLLAFIGHEGITKEFKLKVEGTDSGGDKLKVEFKFKITITT